MLTLYYVSATFLQSWRINKIYQKINEQLAQQASITFYALPEKTPDGFDKFLATSVLGVNRNSAKVSEILWLHNNKRGCSLQPLQIIPVASWITFPEAPSLQPFAYGETPEFILKDLKDNANRLLHVLLETDAQQCAFNNTDLDIIKIENYGKLIAWKIDSHLAVLIEMNVEYFTKFLINTFLQNNFFINDRLTLLRIESVKGDGKPQPFEMVWNHLKKPTRIVEILETNDWIKHLDDLKSLCVLANQATEYLYNRSRNESKTGAIQPDLIPPEKRLVKTESTNVNSNTKEMKEETNENNIDVVQDHGEQNATLSVAIIGNKTEKPMYDVLIKGEGGAKNEVDNVSTKDDEVAKSDEVINAMTTASTVIDQQLESKEDVIKIEHKHLENLGVSVHEVTVVTKDLSSNEVTPTKSPSKLKAKPTNVKKLGGSILDSHRFKTSKNTEPSKQTSVLEKIAALKVSRSKSAKSSFDKEVDPETGKARQKQASPTKKLLRIGSKAKTTADPTAEKFSVQQQQNDNEKEIENLLKPSAVPIQMATTDTITTPIESKVGIIGEATKKQKETIPSLNSPNTKNIKKNIDQSKLVHLKQYKDNLKESKPPNVLIYAESTITRQSANETLNDILAQDTYTVYNLTSDAIRSKTWADTTALLVVCGTVPLPIGEIIVDYFLRGGKVLSLCSDILHFILPNYRTAEVREHELVQFSYEKWHKVKMMHHIFCYQPSPVRKNFSTESDDGTAARKPALVYLPRSIELMDLQGHTHNLDVKILGTEETWNTPSLLLAQNIKNGGAAVFSQVHLEIHPSEFEADESKYPILKQNELVRYEIFADLLMSHLGLNVKTDNTLNSTMSTTIFQNAYFLGRYEEKSLVLEKLKEKSDKDRLIQTPNITLKFCGPGESLPQPNNNVLPILIHSCPEDFSTVEYFENLKTKYIGRLVIYAPVISSSQHIVRDLDLTNGLVVIARQQTNGIGRDKNQWLSPPGCVMFSLQLHIPLATPLGKRLPLIQHIISAAIVNVLRTHNDYKCLDVALKWPNDIYAYGINKIGGLCLHSFIMDNVIVSAGCGLNLDNDKPTICINDMIRDYNNSNKQEQQIPMLKYELLLASIFNETERLLDIVKAGDFDTFYKLYYSLWLHSDQIVTICDKEGIRKEAQIIGIDDNGYLQVKLSSGMIETVFPDGNSFDMLKGLIIPKVY